MVGVVDSVLVVESISIPYKISMELMVRYSMQWEFMKVDGEKVV